MKIHYDGRTYASLAELPPEGRKVFEQLTRHLTDVDGNGVPDLLEGAGETEITLASDSQLTINQRIYHNVHSLRSDDRQLLHRMRGLFDQIEGRASETRTHLTSVGIENGGPRIMVEWPNQAFRNKLDWSTLRHPRVVQAALVLVGLLIALLVFSLFGNMLSAVVQPIEP